MSIRILESIQEIDAAQWNALQLDGNPFVRHEFLSALERQRCAHPRTGWTAAHLLLAGKDGSLRGALPLYLKTHSWGEFVFDWAWANAYHRAGLDYYPKLVCMTPFTPATAPKLLCAPGNDSAQIRSELASALLALAREQELSSAHVLYGNEQDQEALQAAGFFTRHSCQFHWRNRAYESFEHFLAEFRADKRKKLQRERRRVQEQGLRFETLHGAELDRRLWKTVFEFSATTFERHGHEHYLNAEFFYSVSQALPEQVMVKLALHGAEPVAAAIFFVSRDTLYGRYWGSQANYHSLHFEACYYQGIEYCIAHKLARFEPGTQGEHKIPRGFEPTLVPSAHYIREPRFSRAIVEHVRLESAAVEAYAQEMQEHLPFHRGAAPPTPNVSGCGK